MKLREVLDFVDKMKPGNPYDTATKIQWLNELEGDIQSHLLNTAPQEIIQYTETDMDATLLIPAPFDRVYWPWVAAMIDFANGEYSKYQNTLQLVNDAYDKYAKWFHRKFHEDTGGFLFIGGTTKYGLSAYEIAANHGFKGTEEEWLDSLVGEIGPQGPVGAGLNIKGQVGTEAQLPALDGSDEGTAYLVGTGVEALLYIWDGSAWFYKQPLSVKGEDFTYEDFTPEQLELLRGPRGYQGEPVNVERVLESPDDGGINTVFFTDGTQLQVRNGTKGGKGDPGYTPQKGTDYTDGENGGYYTPQISQVDADTAQVRYTPSKAGMPAVPAETLKLPKGQDGEDGKDYILTEADKRNIATLAAALVDIPELDTSGFVQSVNGIEPDADGNVEIEASAQNVVNVRDYGAAGDGVTDDTAAIAAAIADLNAGDTLYFPEGVYRVSNIDLKSDMRVLGDGWCSVITLLDNTSGTHNNCLNMVGSRSTPIRNIIIRDIKLDGNRMTDGEYKQMSTGDSADQRLNGMHIRFASDIYAENVWMHNNGYHGCIMTYAENVVIQNCKSTDNGFRPIHGHTQIFNCRVSNCVCENNGLGLQGGSGYENDSIFFFGAQNVAISGNLIKSNRRGCITVGTEQAGTAEADRLVTKNITISGNVCECYADLPEVSPSESDTGVRKFASIGIVVYGGTYGLENVTVTGNVIIRAQYGMHLYAEGGTASLNTTITGNAFMDCSDGILAKNALDVTVSGNQFKGIKIMWIYGDNIKNFLVSGNNVNALGINQPFKIQNSADVAVLNNNIIGDKAYAIYVPASNTGCVVSGNTMYGFTLDNPVLNPNGYTANNVPGTEPSVGGFVASTEPPADTNLLWVDTDDNSGNGGGADYPTDDHINALIDAKLGVIANASY